MAAEGLDVIVTTGGLGPTADDLTAEIVARFSGREFVLDKAMEAKIAEILRGFARRYDFDEEAVMEANRKQAMVPQGAVALDPVGTAPGLVVPGEPVVVVLPGPPRELQPMWPVALETEPLREVLGRATPLRGYTLRMFGVPESEIAKSLREMEESGAELEAVEITTCLRRGEIEIDVRYRDEGRAVADEVRDGPAPSATGGTFQPRRRDDRRPGRGAAEGPSPGSGRVLQRRSAGGPDHQPSRRLGIHAGQHRHLLLRGQRRAARGGRPAAEGEGRGLAGGGRGDGDRRPGALRGRRRGLDHRHRRSDRGQRGEAGRLRLLPRPPRRRHRIARDPVIPGGREDIRERSALVGMHLLRILLGGGEPTL